MADDQQQIRSPSEIRRVFELLDNVNTAGEKGDTFRYGMQVGKLIALGWILHEVPTSDLSLHYEYDDWVRDAQAQEESLRRQLSGLKKLLDEKNED